MTDDPCAEFMAGDCQQAGPCISQYLDDCPSDPECQAIIKALVERCPQCSDTYVFEMRVRRVVSTRCSEQVPDVLRAKIFQAIQDAQRTD